MRKVKFKDEAIRDVRGRELVCFTTATGVRAIVAPWIPASALLGLIRKLERKIARREAALPGTRSALTERSLTVRKEPSLIELNSSRRSRRTSRTRVSTSYPCLQGENIAWDQARILHNAARPTDRPSAS
mgnify:CR=1 FL=1